MNHLLAGLLLLPCVPRGDATNGNVLFDAAVIEALENGPVVVLLMCQNRGPGPITLAEFRPYPENSLDLAFRVYGPRAWELRQFPKFINGTSVGSSGIVEERLKVGDTFSRVVYLHHRYSRIPSGKYVVPLTWTIPTRVGMREVDLVFRTQVKVNIVEATPKAVESVRDRLLSELRTPSRVDFHRAHVGESVRNTRHVELLPVTLAILAQEAATPERHPMGSGPAADAIRHMMECPSGRERLVEYLCAKNPEAAPLVFRHVLDNDVLGQPEFRRLDQAHSHWVRAMTWVLLSGNGQSATRNTSMLGELKRVARPLIMSQVQELIVKLDSPVYAERELATVDLSQFGERVLPALRNELRESLSVEQRSRLEKVISNLERNPVDPIMKGAVQFFEWSSNDAGRLALEALSENPKESWVCKEARSALERMRKRSAGR